MTSETEVKEKATTDAQVSEFGEKLQRFAKPVVDGIVVLVPLLIHYGNMMRESYAKLPQNVINFLVGFVFCFFGGLYPVLFAAIEAAEHCGRKAVMDALTDLADEASKIIEESKKDDMIDSDGDGKADVKKLDGREFVTRKCLLVLRKMNPNKVDKALSSIYQVWLSVAAVLTIQFARTISLSLAIADFMKQPVDRFIAPVVQVAVPNEYDKWVPIILGWLCKSIGMSIAWYIQAARSAFASALTGGLIMARAAYHALLVRNIRLGGLIKDSHRDSSVDEYMSYMFAAMGFTFQLMLGFDMPFPFNWLLWPFELGEWLIRWSITSATKA